MIREDLNQLSCLAEFNNEHINKFAMNLLITVWPKDNETLKDCLLFIFNHFQFLEAFIFKSKCK